MTLSICVAQLNFVVGDMAGNAQKIIDAARQAHARGVRLLLTPELAICGYPAEDLWLRPGFLDACDRAMQTLALQTAALEGLHIVVGHPARMGEPVPSLAEQTCQRVRPVLYNAASVLLQGRVLCTYAKSELPTYGVFDERRYFAPGHAPCVFELASPSGEKAIRVGVLICEDAWLERPAAQALAAGAQLLVVLNASPFHVGKLQERQAAMRACVAATGLPLVYAHGVGGQDELVFDGSSFVMDASGLVLGCAPAFLPTLFECTLSGPDAPWHISAPTAAQPSEHAQCWHALVLGVRDYVEKNRFASAILGLSGGIDSALVLAIAVDALGKDRVRAVMMPSAYTAQMSCSDARLMAERLGVHYSEIPIGPLFGLFKGTLAGEFAGLPEDATEENLQARIRGTLLMALSNKTGSLVLTTGNKSEMATGYCTLYGDMAGGFAVLKDVLKTVVFELARWRNANDLYGSGSSPIPERIITRAPSAELRPDQKDQDSLPPYSVLDAIVQAYMERDQSPQQIVAQGYAWADVSRVVQLIRVNEYKRRQAPVGIRVTRRGFGKDWRYPITHQYRD